MQLAGVILADSLGKVWSVAFSQAVPLLSSLYPPPSVDRLNPLCTGWHSPSWRLWTTPGAAAKILSSWKGQTTGALESSEELAAWGAPSIPCTHLKSILTFLFLSGPVPQTL